MKQLNISTMITDEEIKKRVQEIGNELTNRFKGEKLVAICVLRGSFVFFADLVRTIQTDITCEFFGVASYHDSHKSSGEVKVTLDLSAPIEGQNVILVEDIVDTGLTMNYLKETLLARKPKSLTTVTLLQKPDALKVPCELDYIGFSISNVFVVGYGLDYQGYYRQLPYIARVDNLN